MASTSALLPVIGYAILASLAIYLVYRVIIRRRNVATLPNPVLGSATKSAFSFAQTTGWNWRRWSFPTPWSKSSTSTTTVKATKVSNPKNLSVELLPTTGLPPHPTSTPTPTGPLVDLTPPTPPLTTTSSTSVPASPRTPSPSLYLAHKSIHHPSYPRPPSPHTLLATTSPSKHKRSRSLGGVPVRRLSGGNSGLRNKVDFDLEMRQFDAGHTRDSSREHLLIDFSSSGSSDEEKTRVSPAASDIGVLPVSSAPDFVVQTRPVPLVDLGDDDHLPHDPSSDDDGWRWFGPSTPSHVKIYTPQPAPQRVHAWAASATERVGVMLHGQGKRGLPATVPFLFRKTKKLVDVQSDEENERDLVELDSAKTLVDFNDPSTKEVHVSHEEVLVDVRPVELVDLHDIEAGLGSKAHADPFGDEYAAQPSLVDIAIKANHEYSSPTISPQPLFATPAAKGFVHHPLEDLIRVDEKPLPEIMHNDIHARGGLLFSEADSESMQEHELLQPAQASTLPPSPSKSLSPLIPENAPIFDFVHEQGPSDTQPSAGPSPKGTWNWDEAEDPWGNHVVEAEGDVDIEAARADFVSVEEPVYVELEEATVVEKSPSGSLSPTVLENDDEEEVPELVLDAVEPKEQPHAAPLSEEEATPKPTPAPMEVELPVVVVDLSLPPSPPLPVIVVEDIVNDAEAPAIADAVFPDPDLLPLPELLLPHVDALLEERPQIIIDVCLANAEKPKPTASQTPTPPASPPPLSPLRVVPSGSASSSPRPSHSNSRSLPPSPHVRSKNLSVAGEGVKARSRPVSPRMDAAGLPSMVEGRESTTETPVALSKPLWAISSAERVELMWEMPEVQEEEEREKLTSATGVEEQKTSEPVQNEGTEVDIEIHTTKMELSSSLPGSFPESAPAPPAASSMSSSTPTSASVASTTTTSTTIGARLAATASATVYHPSARAIVRSPLDIALAMQLRPGLGLGADPAWMVRFLMAMFGWLAVAVSGQTDY